MRIAMTGATGKLGRLIVNELLHVMPASQLIASVRNLEAAAPLNVQGIEVRYGEYNDPESLAPSFAGADKLLLISSSHPDDTIRLQQHTAAIQAALKAGVKQIVYTSIAFAEKGRLPLHRLHLETERAIRESGISFTFLRNAYYTELLSSLRLREAVSSGILTSPNGEWKFNIASRIDLASAAATVLTEHEHANRTYELTAPRAIGMKKLARMLAKVSGRNVTYQMDEAVKNEIYGLLAYSDMGSVTPDLKRLTRRPLRKMEEELEAILFDR